MRTFGKDTPEIFAFKIEGSKKTYKIPYASSLTNKALIEFEETKGSFKKQVEWLTQFMGDDVYELTPQETGDILRAWSEESSKQGVSPGE